MRKPIMRANQMQVFLWFFKPYFYVWILDWCWDANQLCSAIWVDWGMQQRPTILSPRFRVKKHVLWKVRTIIPFCDVVIDQLYRVWRLFRFPDQKSKRSKTIKMILLSNVFLACMSWPLHCTPWSSDLFSYIIQLSHTISQIYSK